MKTKLIYILIFFLGVVTYFLATSNIFLPTTTPNAGIGLFDLFLGLVFIVVCIAIVAFLIVFAVKKIFLLNWGKK